MYDSLSYKFAKYEHLCMMSEFAKYEHLQFELQNFVT